MTPSGGHWLPETCAIADQECLRPAGYRNGMGWWTNDDFSHRLKTCSKCEQKICDNCSVAKDGKRLCHDCAGDESALEHITDLVRKKDERD